MKEPKNYVAFPMGKVPGTPEKSTNLQKGSFPGTLRLLLMSLGIAVLALVILSVSPYAKEITPNTEMPFFQASYNEMLLSDLNSDAHRHFGFYGEKKREILGDSEEHPLIPLSQIQQAQDYIKGNSESVNETRRIKYGFLQCRIEKTNATRIGNRI